MFLKKNFFLFLISGILFGLSSCKDDDPVTPIENPIYEDGVFIVNEGPFQNGSGSISFYSRKNGEITNNIYQNANNGVQLGNIVQSMTIHNGLAYIVVNNANKIIIADGRNFEKVGEITGLELPRNFLPVSDEKAFVSQWGAGGVTGSLKVIDLTNNTVSNVIDTRPGPESMIKSGDFVYVTNSGGFTADSVISKIDIASEAIVKTIEVGQGPDYIVSDRNGDLWILGHGNYISGANGSLSKVSNDNLEVNMEIGLGLADLTINNDGDELFYITNGLTFSHIITETTLDPTPFISRYFYGLGVDPQTDEIMALDAKDFSQDGLMIIYDNDGIALDSSSVGVVPGGLWFE